MTRPNSVALKRISLKPVPYISVQNQDEDALEEGGVSMGGPWRYLPNPWRDAIGRLDVSTQQSLEEVRFREGRPVYLYGNDWISPLPGHSTEVLHQTEIERVLAVLADHSIYAHVNELRQGFITLHGGHRVGVAGRAILTDNVPSAIHRVSGLNLRHARAVLGPGTALLEHIQKAGVSGRSFLVFSPPRCGKTTVIRDICRHLGDGGVRVVVVDERSEIAGLGSTVGAGFDLGLHTDVLDAWPKPEGIEVAIRTLSPDVVVVDELGTVRDVIAIDRARHSGVDVVATLHAASLQDVLCRDALKPAITTGLFDALVLLSRRHGPSTIEKIWRFPDDVMETIS